MSNDGINVKDLLTQAGKHLRDEFEDLKKTNPHYAERGAEAENILKDFLNARLPKRFAADTGLVIDFEDNISLQSDIIIYDASNSPIYRTGSRVLILPSDNVASVIEVKSKLDKDELEDAAKKIASVKKLKKSPLTDVDQPVTFSPLIMTKTYGVVFAYESETSLETLAENLKEINKQYPSDQWIDLIVVLDKGIIGYTIQSPFEQGFPGWLGGPADDEFPPPPLYVHLVKAELGDLTLNKFFVSLMSHLVFYRKRLSISFDSILGSGSKEAMTLNAYQYNLQRKLVEVTDDHKGGNFTMPLRYNLYRDSDKKYLGQICRKGWQDGAIVTYSGFIRQELIFQPFFEHAKTNAVIMPGMMKSNDKFWVSSVIPLSEQDFIQVCESMTGKFGGIIVKKDKDDGDPNTAINYSEDKVPSDTKSS